MFVQISPNDALIVVDVQNDFCPNGALAVSEGDEIIPLINSLMPKFNHIVLTQDWHPDDHISFASSHQDKQPLDVIDSYYGKQILWTKHCVQGTTGAELHKDLDTSHAKLIIRKGYRSHVDSYSAFLEADRTTPTGLANYLKAHGIKRVFVAGLATDFCVAWTAIDAVHFGFECLVIDDACRGIDANGSLAKAWADMGEKGVRCIESGDLE